MSMRVGARRVLLMGGQRTLPFSDDFARADGALGNEWTAPSWTIVSGAAVCAPTVGTELFANPGFDADANWTKGAGWSISGGVASHVAGTSSNLTQNVATVGAWYQFAWDLVAYTSGSGSSTQGFSTSLYQTAPGSYTYTGYATATVIGPRAQSSGVHSIDNASLKALTFATCCALRSWSSADFNARVRITRTVGKQAGMILCADSGTNPANFLHAYIDGVGGVKLDKVTAAGRTNVITGTATYVAGATLRATKQGTSVALYYNGVQIGTTQTVSDAEIVGNTWHGMFSTSAGNTLDDFALSPYSAVTTLTVTGTIPVTAPDVHATGLAVGVVGGAPRIVYGSGTDLTVEPTFGTLTCAAANGTPAWTYNSPANDYCMGIDIGDIDGDGGNEVVAGFRLQDHAGILLNGAGAYQWTYDLGADTYCRVARIGELRSDHAGKEALFGGRFGVLALVDKDGQEIWRVTLTDTNYNTVQSAWIADADGDGQAEILVACGDAIRKHRASDGAQVWKTVIGGLDNYTFGVTVGKVTSASGLQVVACCQTTGVFVLDSAGNILWSAPGGYGGEQFSVAVGDVDGDGYDEVFVGHGSSGIGGIILYDHDGHALRALSLTKAVKFLSYADCDGDGVNELVATSDDGNVYIIDVA